MTKAIATRTARIIAAHGATNVSVQRYARGLWSIKTDGGTFYTRAFALECYVEA